MKKIATREAYGKALVALGEKYDNMVVLDADLSKSTKTADFKAVFEDRFFNMGIAEQNLMGVAAGLATAGKIPFASTFAMFAAGRAFEIIRNSICYPKLNVKICATHAGLTVGEDGASHQAIEDLSIMRSLPNMVVLNPADAVSTQKLLDLAAAYYGPVYVRLGRAGVPVCYSEDTVFEIGKANVLREGTDVAILATGIMVAEAIEAADLLEAKGYSVRVIDVHTLKPFDQETILKALRETKVVITAEEHSVIGGLFSAVAETLAASRNTAPVAPIVPVAVMDTFGESGTPAELMVKYQLNAARIVELAEEVL